MSYDIGAYNESYCGRCHTFTSVEPDPRYPDSLPRIVTCKCFMLAPDQSKDPNCKNPRHEHHDPKSPTVKSMKSIRECEDRQDAGYLSVECNCGLEPYEAPEQHTVYCPRRWWSEDEAEFWSGPLDIEDAKALAGVGRLIEDMAEDAKTEKAKSLSPSQIEERRKNLAFIRENIMDMEADVFGDHLFTTTLVMQEEWLATIDDLQATAKRLTGKDNCDEGQGWLSEDIECCRDGVSGPTCHKHTYEALVEANRQLAALVEALRAYQTAITNAYTRNHPKFPERLQWDIVRTEVEHARELARIALADTPAAGQKMPARGDFTDPVAKVLGGIRTTETLLHISDEPVVTTTKAKLERAENLAEALRSIGESPEAQLAYLHSRGLKAEDTRYAYEKEAQEPSAYELEGDYESDARGYWPAKVGLIRQVSLAALREEGKMDEETARIYKEGLIAAHEERHSNGD